MPDDAATDTVRCPTCRAVQEWSDACRRCKSDLRLLRAFATAARRARRACLEQLRSGPLTSALASARHHHAVRSDPESRRLLAATALLAGDWATAVDLASRQLSDDRPAPPGRDHPEA